MGSDFRGFDGLGRNYHVGGEDLEAVAAALFGAVHGGVYALEQNFGFDEFVGTGDGADADADRDGQKQLAHEDGFGEGCDDFSGDVFGLTGMVEIVEQDDELVSAHAGDAVGFADVGAEASGGDAQDAVAGAVAVGVVDLLELVEVEHEQGDALVEALAAIECGLQVVVEEGAGGIAAAGLIGGQAVGFPERGEGAQDGALDWR